jgi:hypothetical protein
MSYIFARAGIEPIQYNSHDAAARPEHRASHGSHLLVLLCDRSATTCWGQLAVGVLRYYQLVLVLHSAKYHTSRIMQHWLAGLAGLIF